VNTTVVTITGNVVNKPEVKSTQHGVPFSSFRLAQTERRRLPSGEFEDLATNFYQVTAFRALGLNVAASLDRGVPVVVHGRLRVNQFVRADGSAGTSVEIDAYAVGPNLTMGTCEFSRAGGMRQSGEQDRLADPEVQASHHGRALVEGPPGDDGPGYVEVDPITGEVIERPSPTPDDTPHSTDAEGTDDDEDLVDTRLSA
jgi:single-strand DNA-binding protein